MAMTNEGLQEERKQTQQAEMLAVFRMANGWLYIYGHDHDPFGEPGSGVARLNENEVATLKLFLERVAGS